MSTAPRHQATLFLPQPVAGIVDEVRATWDPVMAARIGAHLTLVHDASPVDLVVERLRQAASGVSPFRLTLGSAACWGSPEGGIYLSVHDIANGIERLRERVMRAQLAEPPGVEYEPHVTLVHPRTVDAVHCREAWEHLREWRLNREVVLNGVDVVQESPLGWSTTEFVALTGHAAP